MFQSSRRPGSKVGQSHISLRGLSSAISRAGGVNLLHASGNDCQKNVGVRYCGSTRNERNKEKSGETRNGVSECKRERDATDRQRWQYLVRECCVGTIPQASSLRQQIRRAAAAVACQTLPLKPDQTLRLSPSPEAKRGNADLRVSTCRAWA